MYNSLDGFFMDIVNLSGQAIGIASIISILIFIIKISIFWLIIKSAVYNGTKKALEESVAPRMLGLYDQIERSRNSQNRQQYQNNNTVNNQQ